MNDNMSTVTKKWEKLNLKYRKAKSKISKFKTNTEKNDFDIKSASSLFSQLEGLQKELELEKARFYEIERVNQELEEN